MRRTYSPNSGSVNSNWPRPTLRTIPSSTSLSTERLADIASLDEAALVDAVVRRLSPFAVLPAVLRLFSAGTVNRLQCSGKSANLERTYSIERLIGLRGQLASAPGQGSAFTITATAGRRAHYPGALAVATGLFDVTP